MLLNKTPLISVLMTAYNREKYISEAIESVLNQHYKNWELIILDDFSTDTTFSIACNYAKRDTRINVFQNLINIGDYPNRNKAASYAKGEWIMYVDSDDKINTDGIELCITSMLRFPGSLFGMYYKPKTPQAPYYLDGKPAIVKHFFKEQFLSVGPGGTIINRSFFNEIDCYPEKYGPANDMYFNLKATAVAGVVLLPFDFFIYRIHEGQEQNNQFSYLYNNYRYTRDALREISMGLTEKQAHFLQEKNNRRFVVNLFRYFILSRDFKSAKRAWLMADFSIGKFFNGIFNTISLRSLHKN
jgi:glycosyltransferase involved in cell wall biosynthesis